MKHLPLAMTTFILLLGAATWSQPYQLEWSHRTVPAQTQSVPSSSKNPQPFPDPNPLPASPTTPAPQVAPASSSSAQDRQEPDPITVEVTAEQSYDHYESRYRKVKRVESLVYRGGYPEDRVHCNRARYDWFNIFLEDLEVGDRYKVRVTWDDGSHRTIENTIGPMSDTSVFIREPLAYDAGFES